MLLDSAVTAYPYLGIGLLIAMALNSISIIRAYFTLFTGARHATSVSLVVGTRERVAVIVIAGLLLGGGLYPQSGVASRHEAATRILNDRVARLARPFRVVIDEGELTTR
jgi:NADH-quinone oxidoreductase subunit M